METSLFYAYRLFCSRFQIQIRGKENEIYKPEFVLNKWKYQDEIASGEFSHRETILAQRLTMFQSAKSVATRKIESFGDGIQQMLRKLASECRREGCNNWARRYLSKLHEIIEKKGIDASKELKARALIEDAQLTWSQGETETAQHMITAVINMNLPSFTHSKALGIMGEYLAETHLEDTKTIIDKYLLKSIESSSNLKEIEGKIYRQPLEEIKRLNRKRNYQAMAKCNYF